MSNVMFYHFTCWVSKHYIKETEDPVLISEPQFLSHTFCSMNFFILFHLTSADNLLIKSEVCSFF